MGARGGGEEEWTMVVPFSHLQGDNVRGKDHSLVAGGCIFGVLPFAILLDYNSNPTAC